MKDRKRKKLKENRIEGITKRHRFILRILYDGQSPESQQL
jgi:hypothetical protein